MEREPTTLQAVAELQTQMGSMEKRMQGEMKDLRSQNQELQSQTQELQSQNQLLLSKISALSSQNSNAPGILDGADRRKLKQKQDQLRQSGQKVPSAVRQRQLAFFGSRQLPFLPCVTSNTHVSLYSQDMEYP